jgi:transposase-like protein
MSSCCPYCHPRTLPSETRKTVKKMGFYRRRSDQKWIQRFICQLCKKSFSRASLDPCFRQKKRQLNQTLFELLCSGNSQRRCAYLLKINRKTVKRKFLFLGRQALIKLRKFNQALPPAHTVEFDDLETFEHSKCKPLSVTLAVESKSRRILGFCVSSMPAKGLLSDRALKKYGPRADDRPRGRKLLLASLTGLVQSKALIKSDQNPHYTTDVQLFFPESIHQAYPGKRGALTGQGELKKTAFDPLFSLNHTCAKLRADVNRLIRKTWCTTKKAERLRYHLAMTALYHNQSLYAPKRV